MRYYKLAKLQKREIVRVLSVSIDLHPTALPASGGDQMSRADAAMPDLTDLLAAARDIAKPIRRVFPGRPCQARHARRFVSRILDGCPLTDTAVLLASELVTNALIHTHTCEHGTFEVIIWPGKTAAYVAVIDDGSSTIPAAGDNAPAELAESGRGLELVELLATQWGHYGHDLTARDGATTRTLVWFRLDWPIE
jgi:anti-sigma regulatory factor (Ser/Thr protein kinase)